MAHWSGASGSIQPSAINSLQALTRRRSTPKTRAIQEALPSPGRRSRAPPGEASEQDAEDGGDEGGPGAVGQEPEHSGTVPNRKFRT